MTCPIPEIAFRKVSGDPFTLRVYVDKVDGSGVVDVVDYPAAAFVATGQTIIEKTLLAGGITVPGEDAPGAWDIHIDAADTEDVSGRYELELELVDGDGNPATVLQSAFFIKKDLI